MRKLLPVLAALTLVGCTTQPTPQQTISTEPSPQRAGWQLVWQDEFNGSSIDNSKWSLEQNCWGGGNDELQCYTANPANAFVADGLLHIVARKESFSGPAVPEDSADYLTLPAKTQPFTSARLRSKNKGDWRYGRFEVRAKLPQGQGSWPAIWMLPTDQVYGAWPLSGEIDIMEAVNLGTVSDEPNALADEVERRIHGTLHYGKRPPHNAYSGQSYKLPDGKNPGEDFYTYAIEWQAGEIRWYVDGVHYASQHSDGWFTAAKQIMPDISTNAPFDQRFHLLLNLAVGGNWAAKVNDKGVDEAAFPQSLLIDYVRVYQRP